MRSARSCVLVVLLLPACTRDNPAFDGGDGDGTRGSDGGPVTSNGGPTEGGTITTLTTAGPGDASETRTTTDASADGVSADGSVTTAGTDTGFDSTGVDTGFVCEPMFPEPFAIVAQQPWWMMPCPPTMLLRFAGTFSNGGLHFEGDFCEGSTCACEEFEATLDFQVPVPMAASTPCFELLLQLEPATCAVLAYMIVPLEPKLGPQPPSLVVSNVVDPSFGAPGLNPVPLVLAKSPSEDCGGRCSGPAAGYYDLVSVEHGTVIPQDQTMLVDQYLVYNDGSGVDQECTPTARWHATRTP